ncbi:unnamed protein product [Spirodela intermedia]|uniref:Uncharacterized protein n=1 Tax=Spirodela intermedia TaxID=51605 RepID=A0A7I8J6R1_SPIIN|nr:unnamed protein product [Spirodela intermedia]CAA6665927.1 unnamed protein product [Spirodela intermedia]
MDRCDTSGFVSGGCMHSKSVGSNL